MKKIFLLFLLPLFQTLCADLRDTFAEQGVVEIHNEHHQEEAFNTLYSHFDEFIAFIQTHPVCAQKLNHAKERFIRSKNRDYYSTDFFGFYNEAEKPGRNQLSFYYSTHFHVFISSNYPEFNQEPALFKFFETCFEMQKPYGSLFAEAAAELGLEMTFFSLFKVVKYLPSYKPSKPHYDGTAFSLFLDSTDNTSLLLSSYKTSFTIDDFFSPSRKSNSILLIPGTLLTEFLIYPTPHIIAQNGKVRYATVLFAMRPHYKGEKIELSSLPSFIDKR